MKKMFLALLGTALASSMAYGAICPTTTSTNSDCGYILTIASDGSITGAPVVGANPYDGSDDALVGIINNMSTTFTGPIVLSGSGNGGGIFAFDGDGICAYTFLTGDSTYCSSLPNGATGYEGPLNTFSNITNGGVNGQVDVAGLLAGGTTFFALEGSPASITGITPPNSVPEPVSASLMGSGLAGLLFFARRRRTAR